MLTGRYWLGPKWWWGLALAAAVAGCADGPSDRVVHVSGTVTHRGKPLPLGMIIFEPDPGKGNSGPQGHAGIKDGKFDTRLSGKGAVVGPLIVRITGGDGVNPEPFTPFGRMLFDEYVTRVDLSKDTATLTFDVPAPRR
jgi:hypothetical protein